MGYSRVRFGPFTIDMRTSTTRGSRTLTLGSQQQPWVGAVAWESFYPGGVTTPPQWRLDPTKGHYVADEETGNSTAYYQKFPKKQKVVTRAASQTAIDLFMSGRAIHGCATINGSDGSLQVDVPESATSLLPYSRLIIQAVEQDNGTSAAPASMGTITVYGLMGCNYQDADARSQPIAFTSGGGSYTHGGFQQATLGTLTRAEPTLLWDDGATVGAGDVLATTGSGTAAIEKPLPFIHGLRLVLAGPPTGITRIYIDAERRF